MSKVAKGFVKKGLTSKVKETIKLEMKQKLPTPKIIDNETRLIVDKETTNSRIENIYLNLQQALWAAEKAYDDHK